MKRYLLAALAVIILLYPATASAAPIKQCRDWRYKSVVNITTRRLACWQANVEIRHYLHGFPSNLAVTVNYNTTDGYSDVRLHNRNGYVVHFHVAQD
jgi:hypothetical protein